MSREEVADRFFQWLLDMGFPPEKMPPKEKVKEMCHGPYYKVWSSLTQHVESRQVIKKKKLQVFTQDLLHYCKIQNTVRENISEIRLPEEIELWRENNALKNELSAAENKAKNKRKELNALVAIVSNKLTQRDSLQTKLNNLSRKTHFLQKKHSELSRESEQLKEMNSITDRLRLKTDLTKDKVDVQKAIDKSIKILSELSQKRLVIDKLGGRKPTGTSAQHPRFNSTSLSNVSVASDVTNYDRELQIYEKATKDAHHALDVILGPIKASDLWKGIISAIVYEMPSLPTNKTARSSIQSCIAKSAALHCTLVLETIKNRQQTDTAEKQLLQVLGSLSSNFPDENVLDTEEKSELFVLQCERADLKARKMALQDELEDLSKYSGVYNIRGKGGVVEKQENFKNIVSEINKIDRQCVTKKTEIELMMSYMERTGQKIVGVYNHYNGLLSGFQKEKVTKEQLKNDLSGLSSNYDEFVNYITDGISILEINKNQETAENVVNNDISAVTKFYEDLSERIKLRTKLDLSLDLDKSENSASEDLMTESTFSDELKIFLKKFNLEKNRKIVLKSGESLWISQCLSEISLKLLERQQNLNIGHSFYTTVDNFNSLTVEHYKMYENLKGSLERNFEKLGWTEVNDFEIKTQISEGEEKIDKTKKKITETRNFLKKISKLMELSGENLGFWNDFRPVDYILESRKVRDKSYRDFESIFNDIISGRLDFVF